MPLLIDWPALAEVDLWPESTIVCAVADKTWEEALSEVLEPLGLDWRATFGGAIEISSAEKLARDPQLELYPLVGRKGPRRSMSTEKTDRRHGRRLDL